MLLGTNMESRSWPSCISCSGCARNFASQVFLPGGLGDLCSVSASGIALYSGTIDHQKHISCMVLAYSFMAGSHFVITIFIACVAFFVVIICILCIACVTKRKTVLGHQ